MKTEAITINKPYLQNPDDKQLEQYYEKTILPFYRITEGIAWESHTQTGPDNFIHVFAYGESRCVLAYDDYPSGFSVDSDNSVKALRTESGSDILTVNAANSYFEMNVIGSFMLFRVVDDMAFDSLSRYLQIEYKKLQEQWRGTNGTVAVARDILQLAETASLNHDRSGLYALQNIVGSYITCSISDASIDLELLKKYIDILLDAEWGYEFHDEATRDMVSKEVYQALSREADYQVTAHKYQASHLGEMVTLVSAIYGKEENGTTAGITAVMLFDGDEIHYPLKHFINADLQEYFANSPFITANNIEHHLPETLQDYKLVEGSVEIRKIFRRELAYITF